MIEDLEKATEVAKKLLAKEDVPLSEIAASAGHLSIVSAMMQGQIVKLLTKEVSA